MTIFDERINIVVDLKREPTDIDRAKQAEFAANNKITVVTDGDNI